MNRRVNIDPADTIEITYVDNERPVLTILGSDDVYVTGSPEEYVVLVTMRSRKQFVPRQQSRFNILLRRLVDLVP